ncbi:hypothetical protein ASZ90_015748 [hydrocarbon metagenome]|uniref:Uncharacterized protein n=1 Tax=hydrocarbon metagenome TaxID=938273 RepID=A0A0W8F151_9ZZZZ
MQAGSRPLITLPPDVSSVLEIDPRGEIKSLPKPRFARPAPGCLLGDDGWKRRDRYIPLAVSYIMESSGG